MALRRNPFLGRSLCRGNPNTPEGIFLAVCVAPDPTVSSAAAKARDASIFMFQWREMIRKRIGKRLCLKFNVPFQGEQNGKSSTHDG